MSAPSTPIEKVHITRTQGVCGGKPCIAGTRIRVLDVYVWHELHGKSADEIVDLYPQLTVADVYAALTYLWDNRREIIDSLQHEKDTAERLREQFPSKLTEKLRVTDGPALPS